LSHKKFASLYTLCKLGTTGVWPNMAAGAGIYRNILNIV